MIYAYKTQDIASCKTLHGTVTFVISYKISSQKICYCFYDYEELGWPTHALPVFCLQSFFGFGQSAEVDIALDGQETRKTAEVKTEDGKKERYYLYYDGETVSGKVGHTGRQRSS